MNPTTMIKAAQADGLELELDGSNLKLKGGIATIEKWMTVLARNKPALLECLADAIVAHHWVLHFADREMLEVHFNPAQSHSETLAQYPDALAAEPVPEKPEPLLACSDCFGYRRHGESGYCCARPDFPPAYGERHPLRVIPNAGICEKWRPIGVASARFSEPAGDLQ
ncbi:MAG: hypothetical protein R6V43_00280 [Halopseudomonas sp.]